MQDFNKKHSRIKGTIVFFIVMVLLFGALSYGVDQACLRDDRIVPLRNKAVYRIQRESEETIDVIMLGDSLSFAAFTPMVLWENYGFTGYVCGQPGQKTWEAEDLLRTVFKTQSPKVVILETNSLFDGQQGRLGWRDMIDPYLNYAANRIPVFRAHDIWKSFITDKDYTEEHFKGYAFRVAVEPYEGGDYMQETQEKDPVAAASYTHVRHMMNICRDHGAQLILISTPSPKNCSYARHNAVSELADGLSLPYIDMNLSLKEIGIDWRTDSLDHGEHVNLSGAERVTAFLGRYLSENYDIPDHRGDALYHSWEEDFSRYEKFSESQLERIRSY